MPCLKPCCPPKPYITDRDPTVDDCADSVIPGQEDAGGFCPGSYWGNSETGQWWIGVNDMTCNNSQWMRVNPILVPVARVKALLGASSPVTAGSWQPINFGDEAWDETDNYDPVGYTFTAPRDSIYRIEFSPEILNTSGWEMGDIIDGDIKVNNVARGMSGGFIFQHSTGASQVFSQIQPRFVIETKLTAGDVVTTIVKHTNANSITFDSVGSVLYINEILMNGLFY